MFVCVLLAAGGVALEREEHTLARLRARAASRARRCSPRRRCWRPAARSCSRSRCSPGSARSSRSTGAASGCGCWRWRSARSRSRALGVAIGALAREVRAASLLAFLLSLPLAFLALVPAGSVVGAASTTRSARSRSCSRSRPRCRRSTRPSTAPRPALGVSLVHWPCLTLAVRRARARRPAPRRVSGRDARARERSNLERRWPFHRRACAGCARRAGAARAGARDRPARRAARAAAVRRSRRRRGRGASRSRRCRRRAPVARRLPSRRRARRPRSASPR